MKNKKRDLWPWKGWTCKECKGAMLGEAPENGLCSLCPRKGEVIDWVCTIGEKEGGDE